MQTVDLLEFERFGIGGAGHTGELGIETEIILEGSRGQSLALLLNIQPFFGFNRLMQALRETAAGHGAAGVLVN